MLVILISKYHSNKRIDAYIISAILKSFIVFGIYIFLKSMLNKIITNIVIIAIINVVKEVSQNIKNQTINVIILLIFWYGSILDILSCLYTVCIISVLIYVNTVINKIIINVFIQTNSTLNFHVINNTIVINITEV